MLQAYLRFVIEVLHTLQLQVVVDVFIVGAFIKVDFCNITSPINCSVLGVSRDNLLLLLMGLEA